MSLHTCVHVMQMHLFNRHVAKAAAMRRCELHTRIDRRGECIKIATHERERGKFHYDDLIKNLFSNYHFLILVSGRHLSGPRDTKTSSAIFQHNKFVSHSLALSLDFAIARCPITLFILTSYKCLDTPRLQNIAARWHERDLP
jgi:hypothetical protein